MPDDDPEMSPETAFALAATVSGIVSGSTAIIARQPLLKGFNVTVVVHRGPERCAGSSCKDLSEVYATHALVMSDLLGPNVFVQGPKEPPS